MWERYLGTLMEEMLVVERGSSFFSRETFISPILIISK